jgi:hypothetical protein
VHFDGQGFEHLDEIIGELGPFLPLLADGQGILEGRDVAGQEKIEEAFRKGLFRAGQLGQLGLQIGNREPAEADSLVGIESRNFPDHAFDAAHPSVGLGDRAIGDLHVAVLLEDLLNPLSHGKHFPREFLLQSRRHSISLLFMKWLR